MSIGLLLSDLPAHTQVANQATGPGPMTAVVFLIPDAATADYDVVMDVKFEVVEVVVRKDAAGAGNTVQIKSTAVAITDAIAAAVDKAVTRAGTIDHASNVVPAGGVLRCSAIKLAGSMACLVTVLGFVRA